jgi:hypothetical protein
MSTYAVIVTATDICDNVIVWDDTLGPWSPPVDHYTANIDGLSVGIGWHYDPAMGVWVGPPSIEANFSPAPIFVSQTTTLLWSSQNVDSVMLSTDDGQTFPANGFKDYTPTAIGKFTVTVTATGIAGSTSTKATVTVVASQAELGA